MPFVNRSLFAELLIDSVIAIVSGSQKVLQIFENQLGQSIPTMSRLFFPFRSNRLKNINFQGNANRMMSVTKVAYLGSMTKLMRCGLGARNENYFLLFFS